VKLAHGFLALVGAFAVPPGPTSAFVAGERTASTATASAADDAVGAVSRARARIDEKDWQGAVDILREELKRSSGDASEHELLGTALSQLGRLDEAAHHLEIAVRGFQTEGKDDRARQALALLHRADPFQSRRATMLSRIVETSCDSAEGLVKSGDAERALRILERLPPAATPGKQATRVESLLAAVRTQFQEVQLDGATAAKPAAGELPLFEHESEHYRFACRLEPDVVKRVGTLMDDLHAFYVQVYFDGDAKKASAPKPLVKVHVDKAAMAGDWAGGGAAPEGWWSPGSNEVVTYDTRNVSDPNRKPSLDPMMTTLFHEASHQFMSLLAKGGYTPAWINEGTATFFEGTVAMADGRVLWPGVASDRLRDLVRELGAGTPTARDTIAYAGAGSYSVEYYAFGWGLCWFLQQYEDPKTLEYVYRPLYAEYRAKVIQRGGEPMKVFEEVFLGRKSPLGHATFEDFERTWKDWILRTVAPLEETTPEARVARLARVQQYLMAAERAKTDPKSPVGEAELLRRALGDVEYVRARIDKESKPDGELLVTQIDLLERLKRTNAAAPLIERVLDLADEGRFDLDPKRYAELGKRLARIDQRNAALRTARSNAKNLARSAAGLLADYRASKEPLILRSYTYAAIAGNALADTSVLLPAADELRGLARERGLLLGSIRALGENPKRWDKIQSAPPVQFKTEGNVTVIDCVRATSYVDLDVPVTGEYEIRARIVRTAAVEPGSAVGFVVAGTADGDWTMLGFDERGTLGTWRVERTGRGGTSLKRTSTLFPKPPIDPAAPLDLAIRVGRDGRITVTAKGTETLTTTSTLDSGVARNVGIFAKNTVARFESPVVEIFP